MNSDSAQAVPFSSNVLFLSDGLSPGKIVNPPDQADIRPEFRLFTSCVKYLGGYNQEEEKMNETDKYFYPREENKTTPGVRGGRLKI